MFENLFGELDVAFGSAGAGVVGQDRLAETGGLGQADAAGNDGLKIWSLKNSLRSAATWRVRLVRSSNMVRRMPSTRRGCWNPVADAVDGVHEFGDAFEGEELALDGDEDGIGGDQGVEGQEVEGGRAVDDDEAVIVADFGDAFAEAEFAVGHVDEFEVGADEVFVGGDEGEAFEFGGDDGVGRRGVAQEDVVDAGPLAVFGDAEAGGGIALGVGIDDEDTEVIGGQGGGQVDGGRGFTDPAFLVGNREYRAQAAILARVFHVKQTNWRLAIDLAIRAVVSRETGCAV